MKKKQKFWRGHRVKVAKELGDYMSHFESDVEAIVVGSYRDLFGGDTDNEIGYELLLLEPKPHRVAWYDEWQLTLLENHTRDEGEKLLQKYGDC